MRGIGIQLTQDFDLLINNQRTGGKLDGFVLAKTINQNTAIILDHQPGQFKDWPTLGVGLDNSLLDENLNEWRRKIKMELEKDGQTVSSVSFTESELIIDAKY